MQLAALLLPHLLVGCVAPPETDARATATSGIRSVLAIDFAKNTFAKRTRAVADRVTGLLGDEVQHTNKFAWSRMITGPDRRLAGLAHTASTLATRASRKRFEHNEVIFGQFAPSAIARDVAESMASVPVLLGTDRQPMGEIDDLRHRTDPHDDRATATLLERLRRRLRL